MARVKTSGTAAATTPDEDVSREMEPQIKAPRATAVFEVPLAAEPCEPIPHFVEAQLRSAAARAGLARLRDGMIAAGTQWSGRPVASAADALRALLEQLGNSPN